MGTVGIALALTRLLLVGLGWFERVIWGNDQK